MNTEQLDKEIKRQTIEYDIHAYRSQISQKRRKILEAQKVLAVENMAVKELEEKIGQAEAQLASI